MLNLMRRCRWAHHTDQWFAKQVSEPAALASLGNLLEMKILQPHRRPTEPSTLRMRPRSPRWFWGCLKFENYWHRLTSCIRLLQNVYDMSRGTNLYCGEFRCDDDSPQRDLPPSLLHKEIWGNYISCPRMPVLTPHSVQCMCTWVAPLKWSIILLITLQSTNRVTLNPKTHRTELSIGLSERCSAFQV